MYLRVSELTANARWIPTMNHFYRDHDGNWWFTTVGKGNKQRQIAVSTAMLKALKRWRQYLGLPSLPSPADSSPLLPKMGRREYTVQMCNLGNLTSPPFSQYQY